MSEASSHVPAMFGSMVFNEKVMKERLPKDTYKALKKCKDEGIPLDMSVATVVANAMKDWALEKGATHYTHWFQPMTGVTAEKHDSFISPTDGGGAIMEFSGKELVRGEPDASSFPSGGLRATFEARGYTAWDPTTYAFVKDGSLYIPTVFFSYGGEALDKKTPLLRSMDELSKQALRVLRLFGDTTTKKVIATVGPEQEYFLIDKKMYDQREDLIMTGRTLFGAKPPKGQEMDDHYFGALKPRVSNYMKDLDEELWKLGILAKTKHNEVAPAQHELAPIFGDANTAADHNQLTMEIMKNVAAKHGLVCLLHEKPFAGVNGSGKHDNWAISTDTGKNLLDPGKTPRDNAQFLLFLVAIIKGVDDYQEMLRCTVASAGNDHRLGANEAPPAVVSVFLGSELNAVLESIEKGTVYKGQQESSLEVGVDALPHIPQDTTDRNRTSPFAFTGNKFEFRMLGSEQSISGPNIALNTIVAEELCQFADKLEKSKNFNKDLQALLQQTLKEHKRIIFNGNGYDDSWIGEAEARGLANLKNTPEAMRAYISKKNIKLFTKHNIYTETEMKARYEIHLESYSKIINIEAQTAVDMVKRDILPAVSAYTDALSSSILGKRAVSKDIPCIADTELLKKLSSLSDGLYGKCADLEKALIKVPEDTQKAALYYHDKVFALMQEMRAITDEMETMTASEYWPYPTYGEMLFNI
ncbi:glutamine synthetase III [bacterium 210917-DFI.7.65]|nr:glutamine synthetase III [Clostridiales bacterium]MCB6899136.1 glutamine synthetase III [bacterium 210917-DFI.7.65]